MPNTDIRFPEIEVELTGQDGNAFAIMGRVRKALREGGATQAEIDEFTALATAGSYGDLLATVQRWVVVS